MRLYTRTGAIALNDAEFGHFEADADGGFNFPDDLSDRLHKFGSKLGPFWETDIERQQRLISEELERRKDPSTLLAAVEQIMHAASAMGATAAASAPAEPAPAPKAPRARKSAASDAALS